MGEDGSGWGAPPPGQGPPPGQQPPPWQQPWQQQPPPPAAWPPPGQAPPGGQPPPGQPPPWSPAPQPAFRPLTLADVLDGMFRLFLAHWRVYAITLGIVLVPLHFVLSYLGDRLGTSMSVFDQFSTPAELQAAFTRGPAGEAIAAVLGVSLLAAIFIQPFFTGVACTIAARAYEGGDPQVAEVLRAARTRYWSLVAVTLLAGLLGIGIFILPLGLLIAGAVTQSGGVVAAGVIVLLGTLVALAWVYVRLALAHVVVVVEGAGPVEALRRSWGLVAGRWWRTFGTLVLASIITAIVSSIAALPFALPGSLFGAWLGVVFLTIGSVVAEIITQPLTANARTLLYFDGRIRREGYDLAQLTHEVVGDPYGTPHGAPPSAPPLDRPFG